MYVRCSVYEVVSVNQLVSVIDFVATRILAKLTTQFLLKNQSRLGIQQIKNMIFPSSKILYSAYIFMI